MKFHYLFLLLLVGCQQEEDLEVEWSFPEDLSHEYEYQQNCLVLINPVTTGEYRMNLLDNTFLILKIYEQNRSLKYKFDITHFTCNVNYCSTGWAAIDDNRTLILGADSKINKIDTGVLSDTKNLNSNEIKNLADHSSFIFETGLLSFKYKNSNLIGVENSLIFTHWN